MSAHLPPEARSFPWTVLPESARNRLGAGPYAVELLQENAYRMRGEAGSLFVKLIALTDLRGQNEIRINREWSEAPGFPGPSFLFCVRAGVDSLCGWEWIDGADLREQGRDLLPRAFARLGQFHALNRNGHGVYGPSTGIKYASVAAMLEGERACLTARLESQVAARCASAFRRLEAGHVTRIHGDVHPGNVRTVDDRIYLVDWGYAANSLSLFDLAYVRRHRAHGAGADAWWHIGPGETDAVLAAYFAASDIGEANWQPLSWAVEVWSALDAHNNACERQDSTGLADSLADLHELLAEG